MVKRALVLALGMVVAAPGFVMAQVEPSMVAEETQGGIRFLSGGIGLEERAAMDAKAEDFNLKLVFAITSREYLSDIQVQIQEPSGKVLLSAQSKGPWFFVKLPEGQYTIQASTGQQRKTVKANVGKGLQTVHVQWNR
ncbi:MAG: hypothetical protein ACUVXD_09445 [Thermodesulfobacteriota bacterium]